MGDAHHHEHHHDHGHEHHGHDHHDHDHDHGLLSALGHHHHDVSDLSDGKLIAALVLNLLLTVVELVVGALSGSLSLMADAAHNFNDCAAMGIAYIARRMGRRGADDRFSFGYKRAELIGALINLTSLLLVGLFLIFEAVERLISPKPIEATWVMVAAAVALVLDIITALVLKDMAHGNLNVRAAFLHHITDALASFVVLLGGAAIWWLGWTWLDPVLTLLIALVLIYTSGSMLKRAASILMDNTPPEIDPSRVIKSIEEIEGVHQAHHLHVRELDEQRIALEVHIVIDEHATMSQAEHIKRDVREMLSEQFKINHSTLEFEPYGQDCASPPCGQEDHSGHNHSGHDHDHSGHDHDHDHHHAH